MAGTCGSLGSLTALHRAAAEARARDAELWVVLAWQAPLGGPASRTAAGGTPLLAGCRDAAVERLRDVLAAAFERRCGRGYPGSLCRFWLTPLVWVSDGADRRLVICRQ
ncbi:hypothetical protein SSAG_06008 [Streptomyces sp. Mg1]|nr:hypothetical protein SSAG_06008 [Streptomyces sp. Mg1]